MAFDPDALIDGVGSAIDLAVPDANRAGVTVFLNVAAGMAEILAHAPVAEQTLDLADVFRPVAPDDLA